MTNEELLAEVQRLGERATRISNELAPDNPLRGPAFQIAAICGTLQAKIRASIGNRPVALAGQPACDARHGGYLCELILGHVCSHVALVGDPHEIVWPSRVVAESPAVTSLEDTDRGTPT